MNSELTTNDFFKLIDLYFSKQRIIFMHQLASFNKFIDQYIPDFLTNNRNVFYEKYTDTEIITYRFQFSNIKVRPPIDSTTNNIMFPNDARNKSLTYSSELIADIEQIQERRNNITRELLSTKVIHKNEAETIATIPIMVKSNYCSLQLFHNEDELNQESEYDPGCYFIVNGAEKIVIPQEKLVKNKAVIFDTGDKALQRTQIQINSEIPTRELNMQVTQIFYYPQEEEIHLRTPTFEECHIVALFKAMGVIRDDQIVKHICYDSTDTEMIQIINRAISNSVDLNGELIKTQEQAINYLSSIIRVKKTFSSEEKLAKKQKEEFVRYLIENIFLPHMPTVKGKIRYVGYMINKLLTVSLHRQEYDDRDSMVNKRVDLVGDLLFDIFKQGFRKLLNERKKYFGTKIQNDNDPVNAIMNFKKNNIEKELHKALSTGMFKRSAKADINKGVAQPLPRLTYLQSILILRRLDSPTTESSSTKLFNPRMFHPTQNGMICSIETPEHKDVGFIKQLTLVGSMTTGFFSQEEIIEKIINKYIRRLDDILVEEIQNNTKVFLNGVWLGIISNPIKLYSVLKEAKYNGAIEPTTSIVYNDIQNDIMIWYDTGRLFRPILRVENNELLLKKSMIESIEKGEIKTFEQFMQIYPGVIEFIDCDEQVYAMIAPSFKDVLQAKQSEEDSKKLAKTGEYDASNRYGPMTFVNYSHCELHPSLLTGTIASTVPFLNHNNGARSILHYAQGKQALGIYATNYRYRLDNSYLLYHPQRQLINTRTAKYTNYDLLPPGENVVIAVMCYTGFNQEDSIILNRGALERGLFRSTTYEKHISVLGKNPVSGESDEFKKPSIDQTIGMSGNYEKLLSTGYPAEETLINDGDVIIGQVSKLSPEEIKGNNSLSKKDQKDMSTIYNHYFSAVVDKVYENSTDSNGNKQIKLKLRSERIPIIGDKFSTKSAQKGTVGLILDPQDMPVSQNGIIPDIIFNPSSIHGRLTMGFMMEALYGKAAGLTGENYDATAFVDTDYHQIQKTLKEYGYEENGTEIFINGMTGEKITSKIFTGPMYYLRLKQMVADRVHSRATGPHTNLMRQPSEGRSKHGGLRIGEMERDCLLAHGMSQFTKEKLLDTSDYYETHICEICGGFAIRVKRPENNAFGREEENDTYKCNRCGSVRVQTVAIPYAFKLLVQELEALSIDTVLSIN